MDLKFVSLIDLFKNHVMLIILMKIQELKNILFATKIQIDPKKCKNI